MQNLFKGLLYFESLAKENIKTKTLVYAGLENQKRSSADVISWSDIN